MARVESWNDPQCAGKGSIVFLPPYISRERFPATRLG